MKAISLWQPWASAMAAGAKRNETRSWPSSYRGELAICSAKRKPTPEEVGEGDTYRAAMALPYGFVLCVVDMFDCVPTARFCTQTAGAGDFIVLDGAEAELGDYSQGRFAWRTRSCRRLLNPVPVVGRQGLFNLPPDVEALVRKEMP